MLLNIQGKLYCLVKLFDKAFCQMIGMSDKTYGEEGLVMLAINDFVKHECKFYDINGLAKEICFNLNYSCYDKKKNVSLLIRK